MKQGFLEDKNKAAQHTNDEDFLHQAEGSFPRFLLLNCKHRSGKINGRFETKSVERSQICIMSYFSFALLETYDSKTQ